MEKTEVKEYLLKNIKPGDTIYGLVRHVSSSGMSRNISFFIVIDGEIRDITYSVAILLDYKLAKNSYGMKVSGCGMDMVFHCIYGLGSQLFGNGEEASRWEYHTGRNGEKGPETDGGYFLKEAII